MDGFSIALIALVVLAVLVLFAGVKTVPQGYNYTVERFGRYTRTLKPGLNIIVPFIDGIGNKANMMEQVLDVPSQEVITRDNATVEVNGVTFYQILDAAERLFAARGFPRTTVKQIGAAAGVNSALLYYYFGDKERLYREVLDRLVGRLVEHTLPRLRAGGSPAARLRRFIEGQAEALAASPNLARLLMRELVDDVSFDITGSGVRVELRMAL